MRRREFLRMFSAAAGSIAAGAMPKARADLRLENRTGKEIPTIELSAKAMRAAEAAEQRAREEGEHVFETPSKLTFKEVFGSPGMLLIYAAIVSGILSGLVQHARARRTGDIESTRHGIQRWKPIPMERGKSVRFWGITHSEKALEDSLPDLLKQIDAPTTSAVILEGPLKDTLLKAVTDGLRKDPSLLLNPSSFKEWMVKNKARGDFEVLAGCALALEKRVFVIDPAIDLPGKAMTTADLTAYIYATLQLAFEGVTSMGLAGVPLVTTALSHIKDFAEQITRNTANTFSKEVLEYTPQQFARLAWDIFDWRDAHVARDTIGIAETDVVQPGKELLMFRGSGHGPSTTRYLSEPHEIGPKLASYVHWEVSRQASDALAPRVSGSPVKSHAYELRPDLTKAPLPQ